MPIVSIILGIIIPYLCVGTSKIIPLKKMKKHKIVENSPTTFFLGNNDTFTKILLANVVFKRKYKLKSCRKVILCGS